MAVIPFLLGYNALDLLARFRGGGDNESDWSGAGISSGVSNPLGALASDISRLEKFAGDEAGELDALSLTQENIINLHKYKNTQIPKSN